MRRHPLLVSLLAVTLAAAPGFTPSFAGPQIRGHSVHRGGSSHGGHHHHGGSYYGGHYYGGHAYVGFGYGYGYYPYYGYPYYYPYAYYAAPVYAGVYGSPIGYIDTDVDPEDAAVFIDGEYVGVADGFDGFPRYLTVTPGRHTVTVKYDGHTTWTRTLRVPPGGITQIKLEMTAGEGIDEGDPSDRGAQEEAAYPTGPAQEEGGGLEITPDLDGAPGFVRLSVSPPGAAVYLDGEFYAPASTLARLHGDLRLESGTHVIEVVMPGYETSTRRVELAPGDRMTLSIELRKAEQ